MKAINSYRASMWFFSGVPSHVNDQHVLSFEGLLLSAAVLPLTNESLLVHPDVVVVQMLKGKLKVYFNAVWLVSKSHL